MQYSRLLILFCGLHAIWIWVYFSSWIDNIESIFVRHVCEGWITATFKSKNLVILLDGNFIQRNEEFICLINLIVWEMIISLKERKVKNRTSVGTSCNCSLAIRPLKLEKLFVVSFRCASWNQIESLEWN